MTQPPPPGSRQPDPALGDERPPLTRREAREREARRAAREHADDGAPLTRDMPTARFPGEPEPAEQSPAARSWGYPPSESPAEQIPTGGAPTEGFAEEPFSSTPVPTQSVPLDAVASGEYARTSAGAWTSDADAATSGAQRTRGSEAGASGASSSLEDAFWGDLNAGRETGEGTDDDGREHRPHTWSSLDYPTAGKESRPKKKRRWLTVTIVLVVIVGLIGAGGVYVWNAFQPEVRKILSLNEPNDYVGSGTTPVAITIKDGDTGGDVASTLHQAGVVKTSDAFYSLLLKTKPAPVFQPGVYQLKKQMSAKAALDALRDPKNKLERTLTIPEGDSEADILPALAKTTGVPLADLQAAAAKPADFGLPTEATSLEGFLFPATYTFDPGVDAKTVLKTLVDRSFTSLDDAGVPAGQRWRTVVFASVVQKEAGSVEDMGKVARVFQNRLDQGMLLQSDATVAYGAGVKRVFTTDAEREDASNPYNTYVHPGLPAGPISNPGDDAIKAAMSPTPGPWLYFVTVDLKNGTTVFSETEEQHDQAVQQLQDWCNASAENDAYCQ